MQAPDVLILGAGAAGIRAAMTSCALGASVTVIDRVPPGSGGASFSNPNAWGIQALCGKERTPEAMRAFHEEILDAGLGCCDARLAQILVEESGPRLEDLLHYGVRFKRDETGRPIRAKGCFSSIPRAFLAESTDNLREAFGSVVRKLSSRMVHAIPVELILRDGRCCGCWILGTDGEILPVRARSTILCLGGGAGAFDPCLCPPNQFGEGLVMAEQAGAVLTNLEFIQFMLALKRDRAVHFLPVQALGQSKRLRNERGDEVLARFFRNASQRDRAIEQRKSHYPFSCRDRSYRIDLAVALKGRAGHPPIWAPGPNGGDATATVCHAAHALNGGLRIDENGATTLPGLFAAGEAAAGPHGADRLGGCMMTATQVFGHRAGEAAARGARRLRSLPEPSGAPEVARYRSVRSPGEEIEDLIPRARRQMMHHLGIIRDVGGLTSFREKARAHEKDLLEIGWSSPEDLPSFLQARSLVRLGQMIGKHALERTASLGPHFRLKRMDASRLPAV